MQQTSMWRMWVFLVGLAILFAGARVEAQTPFVMHLEFDGQPYISRWSKNGQSEFTPIPQPDLDRWQDMLTLNDYPDVKTGEDLAALANQVLGRYQQAGMILATDSLPRTEHRPAEHFVVAVLGSPGKLEAVFARFMLRDGSGLAAIYSYRVTGDGATAEIEQWLPANGPRIQAALLGWTPPAARLLRRLPQSK